MDETSMNQIIAGLGVLAENQNRINVKIDSIIDIIANQSNVNLEMQSITNQQSMQINYLTNQISSLTNKMSDIEIQLQNSSGDTRDIVSSINDVTIQIDGLKRSMDQWKMYSEI